MISCITGSTAAHGGPAVAIDGHVNTRPSLVAGSVGAGTAEPASSTRALVLGHRRIAASAAERRRRRRQRRALASATSPNRQKRCGDGSSWAPDGKLSRLNEAVIPRSNSVQTGSCRIRGMYGSSTKEKPIMKKFLLSAGAALSSQRRLVGLRQVNLPSTSPSGAIIGAGTIITTTAAASAVSRRAMATKTATTPQSGLGNQGYGYGKVTATSATVTAGLRRQGYGNQGYGNRGYGGNGYGNYGVMRLTMCAICPERLQLYLAAGTEWPVLSAQGSRPQRPQGEAVCRRLRRPHREGEALVSAGKAFNP